MAEKEGTMEPGTIILIILAVVVAGGLLWLIGAYNGFVRLRNSVEEAFSTMDVYMKKRYDLIPNLVETVKGYASHERETLENVTKARNIAADAKTLEERAQGETMLTGTLKTLFAVAESYPTLMANQNFLDLQQQLKTVEEDIANSRKYYNGVVREFNTKIEMFPGNLVAGLFRFVRKPMFEVNAPEEREAVKVDF
jgi:LemA protein